jgi:hypothetical protein
VLIFAAAALAPAMAAAQPAIGTYKILNDRSGLCLEMSGRTDSPGAPLMQNWCENTEHQLFRIATAPSGGHYLIAHYGALCLQPQRTEPRAAVLQQRCTSETAQAFRLESQGGNTYTIASRQSELCFNLAGRPTGPARVDMFPCHGGDNQRFILQPASAP